VVSIRAILFDADGVIQHATDDLEARLKRVLGFAPESIDEFVRDVFAVEELALTGEQDFAEALVPVVAKWGAQGTSVRLAECWSSIEVDTGMLALVAQLRRAGYLCALATNQQRYRATHMARVLGYDAVFDRSFYSCELGVRKPDARYFDLIVETLALEPGRKATSSR
jgi:putative hydrolase of the HAD superfamily